MTNNGETRETITQVNRFSVKTCLGLKREEAEGAGWGLVWGIHLEQTSSGKKKNKTNKKTKTNRSGVTYERRGSALNLNYVVG